MLEPALREVGHRWAMGALNVAEEHYATAIAQSILDGLSRRFKRAPKDGRLAVVTGTPEELHALGVRMVADFLEADGWEVIQLGPGAPAHDIAALVESEQPDLVALSTATAGVLDGVVEVLARAGGARAAPVHRRRRPVLDDGDEPDRARVRRRPRHPGPTRARRRPASADPAAGSCGMRIREGGPDGRGHGAGAVRRGGRVAGRARADRPVGLEAVLGDRRARRGRGRMGGERRAADRCEGDEPVGAIVLGARPEWVSPARGPSATSRRSSPHARTPARTSAASWCAARSRRRGPPGLRCCGWTAGRARRSLVAWYERQGFKRSGTFTVRDWHGQVLSMELP